MGKRKEMEGDSNFEGIWSIGHNAIDFCKNIANLTTPQAGTGLNVVPSNEMQKSPNPSNEPLRATDFAHWSEEQDWPFLLAFITLYHI